MPTVQTDDGRTLVFPEGMSRDDMTAALKKLPPLTATAGTAAAARHGASGEYDEEPTVAGFMENIPKSAGRLAGQIGTAVAHPIQTGEAIGSVIAGAAQKGAVALGAAPPEERGLIDKRPQADAVVKAMKGRYGSWENAKKTMYEDPVGFLLDASSVLTGGSSVAERAGFSTAAKALEVAGEVTDPVRLTGKVLAPVVKVAGKVGAQVLGKTTGVGAEAIETAAKGTDEFAAALRGDVSHEEIADNVVKAAQDVADQRRTTYQQQLARLPQNIKLPMGPVEGALKNGLQKLGVAVADVEGKKILDFSNSKITDTVEQATVTKAFDDVTARSRQSLSVADMDTLKQRLSNYISEGRSGAVITPAMDRARKMLEARVPGYAAMTKDYAEASDFLRQITGELSTGASKGTQVRKIHTALNQRNKYRQGLVDELDARTGSTLRDSIAGADMSSWAPRGIVAPIAAGGALTHLGALAAHPVAFAAALASASPRFVGELLIALSKAKRGRGALDPRLVRGVSAAGAVEEQQNPSQDQE